MLSPGTKKRYVTIYVAFVESHPYLGDNYLHREGNFRNEDNWWLLNLEETDQTSKSTPHFLLQSSSTSDNDPSQLQFPSSNQSLNVDPCLRVDPQPCDDSTKKQ